MKRKQEIAVAGGGLQYLCVQNGPFGESICRSRAVRTARDKSRADVGTGEQGMPAMKNDSLHSHGFIHLAAAFLFGMAATLSTTTSVAEQDCGRESKPSLATGRFYRVPLPATTGPYHVGYLESVVVDRSRTDALNSRPDQPRRLPIGFWYPSAARFNRPRRYVTDVREALVLNSLGLGDQIGAAAYLGTDASNDAPVAEGRFPLLVFSPGFGSPFENYQVFAEQLASYGYVVVGVNHPGISGALFLDGDTYPSFADFPVEKSDSLNQLTIDDLQVVLAQIQDGRALPSLILGRSIDQSRVGAFGHSFGGSAAIRWAARNPTVRVAVDLDGTVWGDEFKKPLKTKAMFVRTQLSAQYDPSMETAWKNLTQKSLLVTMPQPEHPTFGDFYFITKVVIGPGADAPEAGYGQNAPANIAFVRNLLVNYFNVTLKNLPVSRLDDYLILSKTRGFVSEFKYNP